MWDGKGFPAQPWKCLEGSIHLMTSLGESKFTVRTYFHSQPEWLSLIQGGDLYNSQADRDISQQANVGT